MNLNELTAIDKNICLRKVLIFYNWTDEDMSASKMRRIHRAAASKVPFISAFEIWKFFVSLIQFEHTFPLDIEFGKLGSSLI